MLEKTFKLNQNKTNTKTEFLAGLTTFLTMAYIIFVNPSILSQAGMDQGAVFVATCLAAAFGSILMGFYANYPIALAPGMGLNAYFTFGVVLGLGVTWQTGLGIVFISGILFMIISFLPIRDWIIGAIPKTLKKSISAGIGLFLAIIGLQNAGIIIDHPATLVTVGDLTQMATLLAIIGFFAIVALDHLKIPGAILISIIAISILGAVLGLNDIKGVMSLPPNPMPTFLQLDLTSALNMALLGAIFAFLFVDLFDTAGTLLGVSKQAGLLDKNNNLPRMKEAMITDSSASTFGALVGTSPTTSYIESASGVKAGGRTGLTAVIVGIFFLLALFFSPLAQSIPVYATAPALLFVAFMMCRGLSGIDWKDMTEDIPAMVTILSMPLTYSIANGIGFGFITYVVIKTFCGKWKDVSWLTLIIAALFAAKFAIGQG